MYYLTFEEYEKFGGRGSEVNFERFGRKASALVDKITNYYYIKNALSKDVDFRRERFKLALMAQINYF